MHVGDTATVKQPQPDRSKWIPWYFVGFFVLLAILDGIFVTIALSTHRGVVTDNAYQKGLAYNQTIKAAQQQKMLGWSSQIEFRQPSLSFLLKDAQGEPIEGAQVKAYLFRATQSGDDFEVPLNGQIGGRYEQRIDFPIQGQWDVRIAVNWQQKHYQHKERLLVQ